MVRKIRESTPKGSAARGKIRPMLAYKDLREWLAEAER